jgi:hypothetical protein
VTLTRVITPSDDDALSTVADVRRAATLPLMVDFIACNSRPRIAMLVLLSGMFVVGGLWMLGAFGSPPQSHRYPAAVIPAIGWSSLIFFGLCGIAWARKFFDRRVQLQIGPSGVRWHSWSDDLIPWSEVQDVTIWSYRRQKCIVLHLRDPELFPGRGLAAMLAGANRKMTGGDISISLTGTDRTFEDAMAAIESFGK